MDVTYCTGLWLIAGNQKRNDEHYFSLIPDTCRMISGKRLVLHCSDGIVEEHFRTHAEANAIELEVIHTPVATLPFFDRGHELVQSCALMKLHQRPKLFGHEKGLIHYWRDYRDAGEAAYTQMLAIWLSKIALANEIARRSQGCVAWIDASIARFCGERSNWEFTRIPPIGDRVQHYASKMHYGGKRLPINASFLQSSREGWQQLLDRFDSALREHLADEYAHDEETILSFCKTAEPRMFQKVGAPSGRWGDTFRSALSSVRTAPDASA